MYHLVFIAVILVIFFVVSVLGGLADGWVAAGDRRLVLARTGTKILVFILCGYVRKPSRMKYGASISAYLVCEQYLVPAPRKHPTSLSRVLQPQRMYDVWDIEPPRDPT